MWEEPVAQTEAAASEKASGKSAGSNALQKYWLGSYPDDVDWDAPLPATSLSAMFDEAVGAFGPNVLANFLGKETTFAETGELTNRLAAGLHKQGVTKGTKVGLFFPNCLYYITAYFAAMKLGAIVINFNPLYKSILTIHRVIWIKDYHQFIKSYPILDGIKKGTIKSAFKQ